MPPTSIRERLASLRGGSRPAPPADPGRRRLPAGFEAQETELGIAWRWAEVLPIGRLRPGPPHDLLGGIDPDGFSFVDTETTGLAGGTGTYAFTVAIARPHPHGIELVQLFLPEPGDEPAFLRALDSELRLTPGIATYNGGSFDLPLLRTRWTLNRMPGELAVGVHLDLLHLSRALLRPRIGSCTLKSVEERLLGFEREGDIAGELIPQCYFDFLRSGWSRDLEVALEHNRQDVLSLQHLLHRLLRRVRGQDSSMEACDWLALARWLQRRRNRPAAWRAYRVASEMNDGDASLDAELVLARRKAVLLEWRLRDPGAALRVVERALERIGPDPDLLKRRRRLSDRVDRANHPMKGAEAFAFADQRGESLQDLGIEGLPRLVAQALGSL